MQVYSRSIGYHNRAAYSGIDCAAAPACGVVGDYRPIDYC
jgi:hypothetical protein